VYVPQNDDGDLDFPIRKNGVSGSSMFVFVTEAGTIEGWNPDVDPDHAQLAVDRSAQGAAYKGVAIARDKEQLYAADFTNNQVEIFNDRFHQIGAFTDPDLPNRFAPFNVAHLNGEFYVAFAKREKDGDDAASDRQEHARVHQFTPSVPFCLSVAVLARSRFMAGGRPSQRFRRRMVDGRRPLPPETAKPRIRTASP
jgi:uncharacterized protein (TIGR03118 family)